MPWLVKMGLIGRPRAVSGGVYRNSMHGAGRAVSKRRMEQRGGQVSGWETVDGVLRCVARMLASPATRVLMWGIRAPPSWNSQRSDPWSGARGI